MEETSHIGRDVIGGRFASIVMEANQHISTTMVSHCYSSSDDLVLSFGHIGIYPTLKLNREAFRRSVNEVLQKIRVSYHKAIIPLYHGV